MGGTVAGNSYYSVKSDDRRASKPARFQKIKSPSFWETEFNRKEKASQAQKSSITIVSPLTRLSLLIIIYDLSTNIILKIIYIYIYKIIEIDENVIKRITYRIELEVSRSRRVTRKSRGEVSRGLRSKSKAR